MLRSNNLFTLEYDCAYTLGPRFMDIFMANFTGVGILSIQHKVQTYSTDLHIFCWDSPRGN